MPRPHGKNRFIRHVSSHTKTDLTQILPEKPEKVKPGNWRRKIRKYLCPNGHKQERSSVAVPHQTTQGFTTKRAYYCQVCLEFYDEERVTFL